MNIEQLESKVSAATEKVEKCKKTIERHRAQMEKKGKKLREMGIDPENTDKYSFVQNGSEMNREAYWFLCDYDGKKDDIKGATQKLEEAERILGNWQAKLDAEIKKDELIEQNCPQVIKDFLERWKKNCTFYYKSKYSEWPAFVQELRDEEKQARIDCLRCVAEKGAAHFVAENNLDDLLWERTSRFSPKIEDDVKAAKLNGITESYSKEWARYCENKDGTFAESSLHNVYPSSLLDAYLKSLNLDWKSIKDRRRDFGGDLLLKMVEFRDEKKAFEYLDIVLEAEKKAKIIDMMARIEGITGKITDAAALHIGMKGDLEGVIIGEKGTAKINTIGAGGYNIQCYHYRTLIHEITEKVKKRPPLDSVIGNCENMKNQKLQNAEPSQCKENKEL